MVAQLTRSLLEGDRPALARALTRIENHDERAREIIASIFPATGNARIIGITGAPGTGKSTLVNEWVKVIRAEGEPVAILAIDPSSPITGGAIMGDRVRMQEHAGDAGVYIRSMASRGKLGGLANATRDAIRVLDAAGFPYILLETVGTGQSEVDVAQLAHTTIVVEAPGLGDEVQAIKAGLLEIADIVVLNKADRPGAAQTLRSLQQMLALGSSRMEADGITHHTGDHGVNMTAEKKPGDAAVWIPPIIQTVAREGDGVEELWQLVKSHIEYLQVANHMVDWNRRQLAQELKERLENQWLERFRWHMNGQAFQQQVDRLAEGSIDPFTAVDELLNHTLAEVLESSTALTGTHKGGGAR